MLNSRGEALWRAPGITSWRGFSSADSSLGEGPGEGWQMGVVLTPSPGTDSVVPYFAVVNGLAACGILCVDVGTFLHQDFDTAQQAFAGCQMQRCGAIARLTGGPAREKRGERKDEGHQMGKPAPRSAVPLVHWVTLARPFSLYLSFNC